MDNMANTVTYIVISDDEASGVSGGYNNSLVQDRPHKRLLNHMQKDTWVPNTRKPRVKNKIQPAQTTCEPTVFSQLDSEDDFHTAPSSPEPGALYEFEEEEKDIQTNQGQFPSTLTFLNSLQEQCLEFERRFESNEERETQLDMKMKNFYEVQESLKLQLLELKVRCSINRNSKPPTTDVERMCSTPKQPVNQKRDAAVEQPNTTAVADITTNTVTRTRKSTTTASLISKASDQQRKTKGKRGAEVQYADYMPLKMDAVMEPNERANDWVTQTTLLRRIEQSNKRRLSINNETDQLKISVPHSLPLQKKKAKISEDVEPYPNNRLVRAVIDKPISKNLFSKSSNSSSSGDENIDVNKSPKDEKISEEAVELIQPAQLITLRNQQETSLSSFQPYTSSLNRLGLNHPPKLPQKSSMKMDALCITESEGRVCNIRKRRFREFD